MEGRPIGTTVRAIARVRWLGIALALSQVFLAQPPPVSRQAAFATVLAVAAYNATLTLVRRTQPDRASPALVALILDFAASAVWVGLVAQSRYTTAFAVFTLVGVEAAVLYHARGAIVFAAALLSAVVGLGEARAHLLGFAVDDSDLAFRLGITLLVTGFVGAITAQSQRRRVALERQASALRKSEERFRAIFDSTSIGMSVADGSGRLISVNRAYAELVGYTADELTRMRIADFTHPDDLGADMRMAAEVASGARSHGQIEKRWVCKGGEVRWVRINASHLPPVDGGAGHVIAIVEDISERKRAEASLADSAARLEAIAVTDVVTGLPNRRRFERLLDEARGRFAILAIDVDNLKVVNDSYGHEAGDAALRAISTALRMGVRDGDVVARIGGDEFAALLPGAHLEEAVHIGDRLRLAMHGVALPHGQARISIGCATSAAGADGQRCLAAADEALYRAKRNGRDRVEAADAEIGVAGGPRRVRWEALVPTLLRVDGMTSVFQPIVQLPAGDVVAYEALGRPRGAPADVSVEALFAAADRIGEGRSLDWVCRRAAVLASQGLPAGAPLFLNVGVSILLDPLHDVDQMLLLLRWAVRSPDQVVLEITEREAVRDLERLQAVVAEYRGHGFRFALDDVGTGHSTFEVLSVVTPEFIKIAGRLTRRADEVGPRSAISALVAFARSSGARVIAEEVENETIAETMRSLGVDLCQGFMWGVPAVAAEVPVGRGVDVMTATR